MGCLELAGWLARLNCVLKFSVVRGQLLRVVSGLQALTLVHPYAHGHGHTHTHILPETT